MSGFFGRRVVPLAILAVWVVVVGIHVRREYFPPLADRIEVGARAIAPGALFFAVKMDGRSIGMAMSMLDTVPSGFVLEDQLTLDVPALGTVQRATARTRLTLTPGLELDGFTFDLDSEAGRYRVRGSAVGDTLLEIEVGAGGDAHRSTQPHESGVVLPAALPLRIAAAGQLVVGREIRARVFDPSSLAGRDVVMRVAERDTLIVPDTAIHDPVTKRWSVGSLDTIPVWRLEERYGTVTVSSWVDEDGRLVRAESPLGFVVERTAYELAMQDWERDRSDASLAAGYGIVIESTAIASNVPLDGVEARDSLMVRLLNVELEGFDLEGGRQALRGDTLVTRREALPSAAGYRLPWRGGGEPAAELGATPLIQATDPRIVETAKRIAGGSDDPVVVAKRLNDWVYSTLRKNVTLSVPSAVQVLESGAGDCNEHTVLYVALARSLGLPARTAVGVVHLDGRFYYHAWPEVWLGRWVAMDPTFGQAPADASHLRFLIGDLARQVELIRLIGRLRLEVQ